MILLCFLVGQDLGENDYFYGDGGKRFYWLCGLNPLVGVAYRKSASWLPWNWSKHLCVGVDYNNTIYTKSTNEWQNWQKTFHCHNPTQLNPTESWVGLIFLRNHKTTTQTTTKTKPTPTFSQPLHNQTRPNSVCNLASTQLEDLCKKIGSSPEPTPSPP